MVSTMWTGIRIVLRLVGDGACDRLTDPPGRVGAELVALPVIKLLDGLDEFRDFPPGSGRAAACPRPA